MSKGSCVAAESTKGATLRMKRAELLMPALPALAELLFKKVIAKFYFKCYNMDKI